jgi:cysteine desulfurase
MNAIRKVYLDNAATTPVRKEVVDVMTSVLLEHFGNPSSTHSFGRSAKTQLETARKTIAKLLHANASEILFTSTATEATNWILRSAVRDLGVKRIITTKTEHHATLHTVAVLESEFGIQVTYLPINTDGSVQISDLPQLLEQPIKTLVSLIHVNNETGEIQDIQQVAQWCQVYDAYFYCDTVQSIGKIPFDLQQFPVDFLVASAHKFHGPKGVGFAFVRKNIVLQPLLFGGEQEKGWRAGTEAVHQIVGMAEALSLSYAKLEEEQNFISELKKYAITQLQNAFPGVKVIGKNTFYNLMNVILPLDSSKTALLLFNLDMKGIAVSRGSACQSGSIKPSHVLAEFLTKEEQILPNIRISFSHFNTKQDVDYLVEVLKGL